MTAARPEGPYSEPVLLLSCEGDQHYPPLVEFFPATSSKGRIQMPATSVAKNRALQVLFSVDIEAAMDPAAWRHDRHLVLAAPSADVYSGIWGQAYSEYNGGLRLFPSRDKNGMGAHQYRPCPREQTPGIYLAAGDGPSLILSGHQPKVDTFHAELTVHDTVEMVWGVGGALVPMRPVPTAPPTPEF